MIRPLDLADLPAALRLSRSAGWNQIEADWRTLLELEPDGCWVFETDGVVAGSVTVVRYGAEVAWIGMVLTLPEYRRRGIARALMQHALADCEHRRIACIKLDATDLGRPLYESLGFVDEQFVERWSGAAPAGGQQPKPGIDTLEERLELDLRAFGADRGRLLAQLWQRNDGDGESSSAGFALGRDGYEKRFAGPCVAESTAEAERLVRGLLARHPGKPFYWDLLPANAFAAGLAEKLGFSRRRRLVRMTLGDCSRANGDTSRIWATAGFEYG